MNRKPAILSWNQTEADFLSLPTNRRVELSRGCLELLPRLTEAHQLLAAFLYRLLDRFVRRRRIGLVLFMGIPVRLWEGEIREPDLVFMHKRNAARRTQQYWQGADLAIEIVSQHGRERDLVTKPSVYARGGIQEYWIVDPQDESVTVLVLEEESYRVDGRYVRGEEARSRLLPSFTAGVDALFDCVTLERE